MVVSEDKELHVPLDNEAWLVRFLRPCKFYPDSAHDLVSTIFFLPRIFSVNPFINAFYNVLTKNTHAHFPDETHYVKLPVHSDTQVFYTPLIGT